MAAAAAGGHPGYAYHRFMKTVVGALHRAGVPLVAGTDAMGFPLIVPGASLHRELQLLTESGLTAYEAIRAATVHPAAFLHKEDEVGSIAVGKRADLLLVDGDPLQDLARLSGRAGRDGARAMDHARTPSAAAGGVGGNAERARR